MLVGCVFILVGRLFMLVGRLIPVGRMLKSVGRLMMLVGRLILVGRLRIVGRLMLVGRGKLGLELAKLVGMLVNDRLMVKVIDVTYEEPLESVVVNRNTEVGGNADVKILVGSDGELGDRGLVGVMLVNDVGETDVG